MSADNWAQCPRCLKRADQEYAELIARVGKSFGKVSSDEYMRLVSETKNRPEIPAEFREDYETGLTTDGEFFVDYRGGCRICGFSHKFKHSQKLDIGDSSRRMTDSAAVHLMD